MEPIGGYFELELRKGEHYHKNAIRLNTARNGFEYVLRARHYRKVYLPYYTCEVMLEPIKKLGIGYEFYPINASLEPVELPVLKEEEAFVYTNYYGLKQDCVKRLAKVYGAQLIVDNAQAFYAEPIQDIDTFYSARKFFGVSDGAYLYTETRLEQDLEQDLSVDRLSHLLKRIDLGAESGYRDFRINEDSLCGQGIKKMSKLTEAVLCGIDYETAKRKRRENYALLDKALGNSNGIHLELDGEAVPMVYPYLTDDASLKSRLIENKVFVATYWPNVNEWTTSERFEYELAEKLIPIPCDQRYGLKEMNSIISLVIQWTSI
ncbi:MAG: hypothetical protein IKX35_03040 [Bacteroidales bacterium]|nr:hypothetical protein [Bacteroidales bacterium]